MNWSFYFNNNSIVNYYLVKFLIILKYNKLVENGLSINIQLYINIKFDCYKIIKNQCWNP